MTYRIDYTGNASDNGHAVIEGRNGAPEIRYVDVPRRGFVVPSIVKTTTAFLMAGGVFFAAEAYAPPQYRPSTIMGTYDARVTAAVKASELQQQAKLELWSANAKLAVAQHEQAYRAATDGVLGNFTAAYERNKVVKSALMQMQNNYVQQVMGQVVARQQTDNTVINLSRLWGRFSNGFIEQGSGDSALAYADNLGAELSAELLAATRAGVQVQLSDDDKPLPTPEEVRADLAKVKPLELPPLPKFGTEATFLESSK
ncbi:hypothetical protein NS277_07315 [Novosphingobium barchaimii]|nr:hypothetical protein NS277_07315 [Novosphingobium barchaimii]